MKEKINNSNVLDAKKKVLQKIQKLNQMKKFYEMVNFSYESNHHNSIYKRNVINVAKSIKTEKNLDKYDIDLAFYGIEQLKKGINI